MSGTIMLPAIRMSKRERPRRDVSSSSRDDYGVKLIPTFLGLSFLYPPRHLEDSLGLVIVPWPWARPCCRFPHDEIGFRAGKDVYHLRPGPYPGRIPWCPVYNIELKVMSGACGYIAGRSYFGEGGCFPCFAQSEGVCSALAPEFALTRALCE